MASFMDNLRDIAKRTVGPIRKIEFAQTSPMQQRALESQGMDTSTPLGPGAPLAPAFGYSTHPRTFNYPAGYNIAAKPRWDEKVSFATLEGLINSYDIAQLCISHRIDSIRSYDWLLRPAAGVTADMTEVTKLVKLILAYPDGFLPFRAWLAKYLYDVLAYDAGTLLRARNRGGQVIGLEVIDGTTIAPRLDAWGRIPGQDPETGEWATAYTQFLNGLPAYSLTRQDLIYVPMNPRAKTPYGQAPLERILINVNTDIRFQLYFMQRFTEGNIPQMFASAPESWTPQQVEDWNARWDAVMRGDQTTQNRVIWVPGGSTFDYVNRAEFQHDFSMWLLQKTAAAYHVVPADLGWTEKVNKANGQVQENVSERLGVQPLLFHIQDLLTGFIQQDLGVPLEFSFDQGTDDQNALLTAQSDQLYVDMGAVSVSDIREKRFGLAELDGATVPRFVMTPSGPMPLSMLMDESAPVDQATGAPELDSIHPGTGPAAPLAPVAPQPQSPPMSQRAAVAKAIEAPDTVRKELAAFRRFVKGRTVSSWRDFRFEHVDPIRAHRLNVAEYSGLRKDAGEVSVAGLSVVAADTGRVLMLQRALDPDDPNGGFWELPGGHIEPGETPREGAAREWSEEVAQQVPDGVYATDWVSPAGNYAGFVLVVPDESCVDPADRDGGLVNPDDPDGDNVEAVAWWDPAQLVNNPAVRPALAADISLLLQAVTQAKKHAPQDDAEWSAQHVSEEVGSGDDSGAPFVKGWRDSAEKWPGHTYDLKLTDHTTPDVQAALEDLASSVDVAQIVSRFGGLILKATGAAEITASITVPDSVHRKLTSTLTDARSEAYVTGLHAAGTQLGVNVDIGVDWDSWSPGDALAASKTANLTKVLSGIGVTVQDVTSSTLNLIGERIASGLAAGESSASISDGITQVASSRAEMIAHTEVARAQTSASFDVYQVAGVQQYDLLLSDGACPECQGTAANGPYDLNDSTGQVPIHPRCRCANAPHTTEQADTGTTGDQTSAGGGGNSGGILAGAALIAAIGGLIAVNIGGDVVGSASATYATSAADDQFGDDEEGAA